MIDSGLVRIPLNQVRMASRYEIVEPEAMEVAEDDVYHPNQSVREISNSVRSLEPIIDGSIGLKTIFYDSRWSRTQRRFCVGILVVFVVICFSLLISLFVGLAKVITFIHYTERIRSTGLMMFPTSSNPVDIPTVNYCGGASSCQGNFSVFTNAIDRVLQKYQRANQLPNYVNCSDGGKAPDGKFCRFNLDWLGSNCTKEKNFGYTSGQPCLLLQLRNITEWTPDITPSFLTDLKTQDAWKGRNLSISHLPVMCRESMTSGFVPAEVKYFPTAGFNISFIPQGTERELGNSVLPPLVMIQFVRPTQMITLDIRCRIHASNLDKLDAIKEVEFNFKQGSAPSDTSEWDYDA